MPGTPTRRERLRAATIDEIQAVARHLLATEGTAGITLRAIGREMGITAPAIYRYYPSLDDLLVSLCALFYDECREHIEAAVSASDTDSVGRMFTACRAFRTWCTTHPAEFTMMFGSTLGGGQPVAMPKPDAPNEHHERVQQAGQRFAEVFMRLFVAMWQDQVLRVPADDEVPPSLRQQLHTYLAEQRIPLPVGAMQAFTSSWIRLYGMVALDVFGHLHFCLTDSDPMFDTELAAIGRDLGVALPNRA